ncbi:hypothetical protein FML45_15950 [Klebsiella variicola]|nr:hypothetical protein [Klebsiella variicola]MBZ7856224.1 hypothetical protein [Klebsiella variicola]HBX9998929.1 hypothetical protein [Klebsiella variicola]HBY1620695.1 hypothetical protein [Klebsiella variicola]
MVSLRLSSRERLAKDTTSSISNSSSLHLPENAGAALTSPSTGGDGAKRCRLIPGLYFASFTLRGNK